MKLSEKQARFTQMVPLLIAYADLCSYRVRIDYVKRCNDCRIGAGPSLHKDRLAIDLLVDVKINDKWVWQRTDKTGCYTKLGEFWEFIGGTFGGRFASKDYNHFSLSHAGRK